jgi:hypothetical protein
MDQGPLVEIQIESGKRLIEQLVQAGVDVSAACWLKEAENGQWFLYLATPLVTKDGAKREAYGRVNAVIREMRPPLQIHPFDIKVIGVESPIAKMVQELQQRYPGPLPFPYRGASLGGLSIEGAYIYPAILAPVR